MSKQFYTFDVHCSRCNRLLYRYQKEGPGQLVKCFLDRIVKDHTRGDCTCPGCGQVFARTASFHNRPAHKIIQGKIIVRGHVKK